MTASPRSLKRKPRPATSWRIGGTMRQRSRVLDVAEEDRPERGVRWCVLMSVILDVVDLGWVRPEEVKDQADGGLRITEIRRQRRALEHRQMRVGDLRRE